MKDDSCKTLDIVTDPQSTPNRCAVFDPDNPDRWIQIDETGLIELETIQ